MYSRKHNRTKKHYRRHGKNCKCRKCCKKTTKRMRHRSRSRRGGMQTAVGGDMIYKGGQWISTNPVGGRS
jgi:hypothetical protein